MAESGNMKIVFFGTPDYVIPILESVTKLYGNRNDKPIVAVVTQKPAPAGRKKELAYSPVDTWAHKKGIEVFYNSNELLGKVDADVAILAAYGTIISKKIINHFPKGILNVHPSLLPEFRGASPVQSTLVSGKPAGATIIKIDEKVDHGQIVRQFRDEVTEQDTTKTLRNRLFTKSAEILTTLIPAYMEGKIKLKEQKHKKATFTTLLKKDHAFINPSYLNSCLQGFSLQALWKIPFIKNYSLNPTPDALDRFIRAMNPWPIAWTYIRTDSKLQKKRIKLISAQIKDKKLVLNKVQLEGKNPVTWKEFIRGYTNATFE